MDIYIDNANVQHSHKVPPYAFNVITQCICVYIHEKMVKFIKTIIEYFKYLFQ